MSADKITPSDTPRTDANERAVFDNGNANGGYTDADFARQLERENAALREQLAERDAELAALKAHAEAMAEGIESSHLEIEQEALAAYRADFPEGK